MRLWKKLDLTGGFEWRLARLGMPTRSTGWDEHPGPPCDPHPSTVYRHRGEQSSSPVFPPLSI